MLENIFLELIQRYSDDNPYNIFCWNEINMHYTAKNRYYHNLNHLQKMLHAYNSVAHLIKAKDVILFSIFYHDIIYKSSKSDNELKSALLFKERIAKTNFTKKDKCYNQIIATKLHEKSNDCDTNYLLDFDLAILASPKKAYLHYCQSIRKEYLLYPNFIYRKGRIKVLKHFLEKESIFKTKFFIEKYEAKAIANLNSELNNLKSGAD